MQTMSLFHGAQLDKVEGLVEFLHDNPSSEEEMYRSLGSPLGSESDFRHRKNLAIPLGFIEKDDSRYQLTDRGRELVEGNRESAYRDAIKSTDLYRSVLTEMVQGEIASRQLETTTVSGYLEEYVGKDYSSERPRKAASSMFQVFERAGLGSIDESGRTNAFNADVGEIKSMLDITDSDGSEEESSDDRIDGATASFDSETDELVIRVPADDITLGEAMSVLNQITHDETEELKLR